MISGDEAFWYDTVQRIFSGAQTGLTSDHLLLRDITGVVSFKDKGGAACRLCEGLPYNDPAVLKTAPKLLPLTP